MGQPEGLKLNPAMQLIRGYCCLYNTPTNRVSADVLTTETLLPGCFDDSIKEGKTVACVNHDLDRIIGSQKKGSLRLFPTAKGIRFELDSRKVIKGITGVSFLFVPLTYRQADSHQAALVRGALIEISILTGSERPAYPQLTPYLTILNRR